MSDKKTKPKTKSKPSTAARNVKTAPKTAKNVSYNVLRDTQSVMKEQFVKQKAETLSKSRQEEETPERPENYATDSIENAAYTASGKVYRVSRNYVQRKAVQKRNAKRVKTKDSVTADTADAPTAPMNDNIPRLPENQPKTADNAPKTKDAIRTDTAKPPTRNTPKTANNLPKTADAARNIPKTADTARNIPKTADNTPKTTVNAPKRRTKQDIIQPKTKEAYIAAKSDAASPTVVPKQKAMQQAKIKAQQKASVKTKAEYISEKSAPENAPNIKSNATTPKEETLKSDTPKTDATLTNTARTDAPKADTRIKTKENYLKRQNDNSEVKTADTARRGYVRDKLKAKSAKEKALRQNNSEAVKIVKSDITADAPAVTSEKPQIKTKESYMKSLRKNTSESAKSAVKEKTAPKSKQNLIARQIKASSKAVQTKQKTASDTVKTSQNVFMASRMAKQKASKISREAVKTQKEVTNQAAKQAAKRAKEMAQQSAQTAKQTAKTTARIAVKVEEAVVKAAKAIVSAIAAGGAAAVVIVVLIIIIIIAAIAASPFGIFISSEVNEVGTVPLSQIIAEYNVELTQEVEDIEVSVDHTEVEVVNNQADTNLVVAVFAAKTAGAEDNTAEDVVIFDDVKAEKLKEYFRAANTVSYTVEETTNAAGETVKKLTVTISGKTKDELISEYSLTAKQQEALETLLEHGDVLTASSQSLAVTDANVQAIVDGLQPTLPQKRKDVVKNAASLVGKVNYFWGGKSTAIGWDSRWGTMQRVTAAGSPSSGTIRAFGLDCSGFVTWAFYNSGMYVGDGTIGQRDASRVVSASAVQAGDLCFLPSYSHVGIVVGKDASGNILVIHCSSGANNVVLATASSVGFTVFRTPNCYY